MGFTVGAGSRKRPDDENKQAYGHDKARLVAALVQLSAGGKES